MVPIHDYGKRRADVFTIMKIRTFTFFFFFVGGGGGAYLWYFTVVEHLAWLRFRYVVCVCVFVHDCVFVVLCGGERYVASLRHTHRSH